MINIIEKYSYVLIIILPLSLITGPAIPDISISLIGLCFLCFLPLRPVLLPFASHALLSPADFP